GILFNTTEKHRAIAEAIQEMWRKNLGVEVTLMNTEWKVYLDQLTILNYDLARSGWIGDYVDPNTFLELWKTDNGNNNTGWSNSEYDSILDRASREFDPRRRMELLAEAEEILLSEMPVIPLFFYTSPYLL